tara:strand:- start:1124 stop:1330 length:207 start_codon:yes stop_codon:yes gene_type:complete
MKGGKLPFFFGGKGDSLKKFAKCYTLIWRALLFLLFFPSLPKGLFSFFAEKRGEAKRRLETPQKTEKR